MTFPLKKSTVVKRSLIVAGHRTSVSIEDAFWAGLKDIAAGRGLTVTGIVTEIDGARIGGNLSSAIRLYVLQYFRQLAEAVNAEAHSPNA